jgi:hypothetical protein
MFIRVVEIGRIEDAGDISLRMPKVRPPRAVEPIIMTKCLNANFRNAFEVKGGFRMS